MKYWQLLLRSKRAEGGSGLTLPFLIGSQKHLPPEHTPDTISDLIYDVIDSTEFETCIRHCLGTKTYIFEIRNPSNSVYYPTYNNNTQSNLSISSFSRSEFGEKTESLIQYLIEEFQDIIDEERYSAKSNVNERHPIWEPFSEDDDIPFIKRTFIDWR